MKLEQALHVASACQKEMLKNPKLGSQVIVGKALVVLAMHYLSLFEEHSACLKKPGIIQ